MIGLSYGDGDSFYEYHGLISVLMSVIDEIKPSFPLEALTNKQKLIYAGHVMRSNNTMEKSLMLSMVEGRKTEERAPKNQADGWHQGPDLAESS